MENLHGNEDIKENEMAKRTPDNCQYIKRCGEPGRDGAGKCLGFAKSKNDDEPCEVCKRCRCCRSVDEDLGE